MNRGKLRDEARVGIRNALVFLAQRSTSAQVAKTLGMVTGSSSARPDPDAQWGRG